MFGLFGKNKQEFDIIGLLLTIFSKPRDANLKLKTFIIPIEEKKGEPKKPYLCIAFKIPEEYTLEEEKEKENEGKTK